MIVFVFGLPGSGKSFFAAHLAKKLNAAYVSSDKLRKKMFRIRNYSAGEKQKVYDEMLVQMKRAAQHNKNVIVDATFYKDSIRKKFKEATNGNDNKFFVEVRAAESLIKERLQRTREDSEADFEVYKKIKREWEPFREEHLILESTDDNIQDMLEKASQYFHFKDDKRAN